MDILHCDLERYGGKPFRKSGMPRFQYYLRKTQQCSFFPLKVFYKALFVLYRNKNLCELSDNLEIGPGLYLGHPFGITINPGTVIGMNVNIHKGVTLGRENRGIRKGAPTLGDNVWIGVNSTIVGKVHIGNDVLIAPNSFVNFDVPDHSIVFGNPATIKQRDNATKEYVCNTI